MAGFGFVIPRQGPGTGPVLLADNGVPGAVNRYVVSQTAVLNGGTIASLNDQYGTANLALASSGTVLPTITTIGGDKVMTEVAATTNALRATATQGAPFSFAVVVKSSSKSHNFAVVDGYRLQVASNGTWALDGYASAGSGFVTLPWADGFHVVFGICDGANSRLGVGTTRSSTAGTILTADSANYGSRIMLGSGTTNSDSTVSMQIAEMNVWPFALTPTQQAAHVTAMQAAHPDLAVLAS